MEYKFIDDELFRYVLKFYNRFERQEIMTTRISCG